MLIMPKVDKSSSMILMRVISEYSGNSNFRTINSRILTTISNISGFIFFSKINIFPITNSGVSKIIT